MGFNKIQIEMKKLELFHLKEKPDSDIELASNEFANIMYAMCTESDLIREAAAFSVGAKWMQSCKDEEISALKCELDEEIRILKNEITWN